ncbi:MAG: cupin domain-containing protein [Deltaproteobacteria bacterium]|nr:cupin domain-containing protein [Deltaproteobacteria bacterium]
MIHRQLSQLSEQALLPGGTAKIIHSERMTFAYWTLKAGTVLPEHSHPHEQAVHVLSGETIIAVEGAELKITSGSIVLIPSGSSHSAKAITDTVILDAFTPRRADLPESDEITIGEN